MYTWFHIPSANFQRYGFVIKVGLNKCFLTSESQWQKHVLKVNKLKLQAGDQFQSFFPFTCDELHEASVPEVYLFLDHTAYMLFFQRQLPSALQLHRKTMWPAESAEVSEIQKKSVGKC